MSEKVVGIRPNMSPPKFEPNESIVGLLSELLGAAEAGEIQGIAISLYHRDDTHSTARAGLRTLATVGNLERLKFEILHEDEHS
ncbi:MAG: hypothetical protein IPK23_15065 [Rhizobiales bacterium]|nr:hypothetical protein [Hyphomicrobiales bacterium]